MNNEKFSIPEKMTSQLNEFSYGGFLLFCFDESGSPRFYAQFDNELNMMGLQKAAEYWLEGVHDINAHNIKEQLKGSDAESPTDIPEEDPDKNDWDFNDPEEGDPFFS